MSGAPLSPARQYDVIVVGGGPTGLVLANLLGRAGRSVLLVEANAATVGEPRAVSIDDEALRVVQAIGLLDLVTADIVPGYGSEYRGPSGSPFLRVHPTAQPYGHPRRNAFRQPIFEAQLRAGLGRFPNIHVRFLTLADQFTDHGDHVEIALRATDGTLDQAEARFLVGCDGARSPIREALGYALMGSSMDERWLILDLEKSPVETAETIVFCDARRPCIALPGAGATRRYEFKLLHGEDDADMLSEENVARLLDQHGAAPGSRIVRKTVYHFHALIADHWGRGRVWLAGDAAHLSPPFAGQGMNSGIRDAFNLAWKLDYILRDKIGLGLLASYQIERHDHVTQMIRLALRMGRMMGPSTRFSGVLTRALFRALGTWPAARTYFAEMKYKPPPRFGNGFLIRSMLRRRGVVGRMLPQPLLAGGQAREQRLDDWLGDGFVLLGVDVPAETVANVDLGEAWNALIAHRRAAPLAWLPSFSDHAGHLLLLRPDRYVLARFAPRDAGAVMGELDRLLMATRPPGASRARIHPKEHDDAGA